MRRPEPHAVTSELVAHVLSLAVAEGDLVEAGAEIALLESMKMEIPVLSDIAGRVVRVAVLPGDVVQEGDVLALVEPHASAAR